MHKSLVFACKLQDVAPKSEKIGAVAQPCDRDF